MEVEERDVYPIVEELIGAEKAASAEKEHNTARDDLARLADHMTDASFTEAIQTLTNDIRHHVSEEENEIFPQLRKNAAADIAALGSPEDLEEEVEAS